MDKNKAALAGWIFMYNPMAEKWGAVTRDNYFLLTSDWSNPLVLKSSDETLLHHIIIRNGGDEKKISKL